MTGIRLVIGTACFGGQMSSDYVLSLLKLQGACAREDILSSFIFSSGDALITRARNEIVAAFLDEPKGTHLLFIDADIVFEPEAVFRLLKSGHRVAAGVYPAKLIPWEKVRENALRGKEPLEASSLRYVYTLANGQAVCDAVDGFVRARWAGTGFLMIERSVLEQMRDAHPELAYTAVHSVPDHLKGSVNRVALFDPMIEPESRTYLSEDYAFCERWRALGGELWVDLRSRLTHIGPRAFVGDLSTQFVETYPADAEPARDAG